MRFQKQRQLFCQLSKFARCAIAEGAILECQGEQTCPVASRYVIYHVWTSLSLGRGCALKIIFSFLSFKQKRYIITSSRDNPLAAGTFSRKHWCYSHNMEQCVKIYGGKEKKKEKNQSQSCASSDCIINRVGLTFMQF